MKHFFYKGSKNILDSLDDIESFDDILRTVKKEVDKVIEVRNLSFLLGSGCSTGDGGIPTMKGLADMFYAPTDETLEKMSDTAKNLILTSECLTALTELGINVRVEPFANNIESFLSVLYSLKFYYEQTSKIQELDKVVDLINHTKKFILYQCLNADNTGKDNDIKDTYKNFYRKLSLRDSNLPRPNIFTTNYDLYSERAMDELGITYTNGFSGFIERYFNPSIFNYALAEQMDISSGKWSVIDSFIYLFKIHGSVNWVEEQDESKLFKVKELQHVGYDSLKDGENLMIYPSAIKQNASLGSPYSDLFREFQRRLAQNQSLLVTIGYSFSDEHVNNLIYQALTIPTFRLVIFSNLGQYENIEHHVQKIAIKQLRDLNDPRIWIIGSDEILDDLDDLLVLSKHSQHKPAANGQELYKKPLHYFSTICNDLLPDWSDNQIEHRNHSISNLFKSPTPEQIG